MYIIYQEKLCINSKTIATLLKEKSCGIGNMRVILLYIHYRNFSTFRKMKIIIMHPVMK